MPFSIIRNDITKLKCDAIVNAANRSLLGGGGVDGAIHRAAGPELLEECRTLGGCEVGEAKITGAYRLPCKYVIHTVGPVWGGGAGGEKEKLESCYRNSLLLAKAHGCESVAFPLISAGAYGYPREQAFRVASDTIRDFLSENEMDVTLVVFDRVSFEVSKDLGARVLEYIDQNYVNENYMHRTVYNNAVPAAAPMPMQTSAREEGKSTEKKRLFPNLRRRERNEREQKREQTNLYGSALPEDGFAEREDAAGDALYAPGMPSAAALSLDDALNNLDESFSEMLLRKIDEKGITDAECYKRANVDRKLFSKIRGDRLYKPSKPTALAFAVALELPLPEAKSLLMKAGFAFSRSSKFDVIVEYFISSQQFDIYRINETLFSFDQPLLGKF